MIRVNCMRQVVGALCASLAISGAQQPLWAEPPPSPLPRGGENPALDRFGPAVVYYVGFEGHALAEIASGSPVPIGNDKWNAAVQTNTPPYEKGVYGQGILSRDYQLTYNATGPVMRASGTLALWLKARSLAHGYSYFWPAMLDAHASGYRVQFGRMGSRGNGETLYTYLGHGKNGTSATMGSMQSWKTEVWHLFVITWDRHGTAFSVDGAAPARAFLRTPIGGEAAGGFRLYLLSPSDDTFIYDELLVLNLPLTAEEIKWMYAQGKP